jgi:septum site-determining protein MinC
MPPILSGGKDIGDLRIPPDGAAAEAPADSAGGGNGSGSAGHGNGAAAASAGHPGAADGAPAPGERRKSLLIDSPVRSGQSVVFMEGDVTVVGTVASGSEVVAGGSIHIYGALRGRAIAGSNGDRNARIFCRSMEAELVAIDGLYKTAEDLEPALRNKPVQSWLKGDALMMSPFN